jgi:hypothetical protein
MYTADFEASSIVSGSGFVYWLPVSAPELGTIMPRIVGVPK